VRAGLIAPWRWTSVFGRVRSPGRLPRHGDRNETQPSTAPPGGAGEIAQHDGHGAGRRHFQAARHTAWPGAGGLPPQSQALRNQRSFGKRLQWALPQGACRWPRSSPAPAPSAPSLQMERRPDMAEAAGSRLRRRLVAPLPAPIPAGTTMAV